MSQRLETDVGEAVDHKELRGVSLANHSNASLSKNIETNKGHIYGSLEFADYLKQDKPSPPPPPTVMSSATPQQPSQNMEAREATPCNKCKGWESSGIEEDESVLAQLRQGDARFSEPVKDSSHTLTYVTRTEQAGKDANTSVKTKPNKDDRLLRLREELERLKKEVKIKQNNRTEELPAWYFALLRKHSLRLEEQADMFLWDTGTYSRRRADIYKAQHRMKAVEEHIRHETEASDVDDEKRTGAEASPPTSVTIDKLIKEFDEVRQYQVVYIRPMLAAIYANAMHSAEKLVQNRASCEKQDWTVFIDGIKRARRFKGHGLNECSANQEILALLEKVHAYLDIGEACTTASERV